MIIDLVAVKPPLSLVHLQHNPVGLPIIHPHLPAAPAQLAHHKVGVPVVTEERQDTARGAEFR